ncbi:hypothetical protein B0H10DRAFT_1949173 [Mycena sp. CBHHK59/15]|nr:hypothetical protein B0H10DRAFT_1949173 [Mycena sp. CBHHK59/15]
MAEGCSGCKVLTPEESTDSDEGQATFVVQAGLVMIFFPELCNKRETNKPWAHHNRLQIMSREPRKAKSLAIEKAAFCLNPDSGYFSSQVTDAVAFRNYLPTVVGVETQEELCEIQSDLTSLTSELKIKMECETDSKENIIPSLPTPNKRRTSERVKIEYISSDSEEVHGPALRPQCQGRIPALEAAVKAFQTASSEADARILALETTVLKLQSVLKWVITVENNVEEVKEQILGDASSAEMDVWEIKQEEACGEVKRLSYIS